MQIYEYVYEYEYMLHDQIEKQIYLYIIFIITNANTVSIIDRLPISLTINFCFTQRFLVFTLYTFAFYNDSLT